MIKRQRRKEPDLEHVAPLKIIPSRWAVRRIAEPEAMALPEEVETYNDYTSNPYFEAIDDIFVEQALSLGVHEGKVLDAGTGPGQIPMKLARRAPDLKIYGIDLSAAMVLTAAQRSFNEGLQKQCIFQTGDCKHIPFEDHTFDMVVCNSVLHHINDDPVRLFNEIHRVVRPRGAILIRDLMRPLEGVFHLHVAWFGRHYHGLLKQLYAGSVRAAYTKGELEHILAASEIKDARIFTMGLTHMGVLRHSGKI